MRGLHEHQRRRNSDCIVNRYKSEQPPVPHEQHKLLVFCDRGDGLLLPNQLGHAHVGCFCCPGHQCALLQAYPNGWIRFRGCCSGLHCDHCLGRRKVRLASRRHGPRRQRVVGRHRALHFKQNQGLHVRAHQGLTSKWRVCKPRQQRVWGGLHQPGQRHFPRRGLPPADHANRVWAAVIGGRGRRRGQPHHRRPPPPPAAAPPPPPPRAAAAGRAALRRARALAAHVL
jgi:hypothetical protein